MSFGAPVPWACAREAKATKAAVESAEEYMVKTRLLCCPLRGEILEDSV